MGRQFPFAVGVFSDPQPARCVFAEHLPNTDIATQSFCGPVTCLSHDHPFHNSVHGGLCHVTGSQAMAAQWLNGHAGARRSAL